MSAVGARALEAQPTPEPALSEADQRFLVEWVGAMGDEASAAAVRRRVRRLLALRDDHPRRPSLEELMTDAVVRAVMFAPPAARSGAWSRLRKHYQRIRDQG